MKTSKRHLMIWGVLLMLPSTLMANGFRNPEDGAGALGQLGGKTTWLSDPSAVVHNPANLSEQDAAAQVGVNWVYGSVEFESTFGGTWETEGAGELALPSVFITIPLNKDNGLTAGLGIHSPYGQFTEWPKDVPFAYTSPYYAEMSTINVTPAVGLKLTDSVSIGAGLDIMQSTLTFKQSVPWGLIFGEPGVPDAQADLEADGLGVGAHAGLTLRVSEKQRLAITLRSPMDIQHDGDARINYIPEAAASIPELQSLARHSRFRSEIHYPTQLGLGYGAQLTEKLRIGLDLEWLEFSRQKNLVIDLGRNQPLMSDKSIAQNWQDTITFALGGAYKLSEPLELRASYKFMESPIPEDTMSPILVEGDQHMFSIGAGYKTERFTLDLAYVLGINEDITLYRLVSDPSMDGQYETSTSHLVSLTGTFPF